MASTISTSALRSTSEPLSAHSAQPPQGRRQIWSSIRVKAALIAITLGTVPVLAIGTVAYFWVSHQLEQQAQQSQAQKAELISEEVNLFIRDRFNDVLKLSQQPIFVNTKLRAETSTEQKEAFLDNYFQIDGGIYNSIAFLDAKGNDIAVTKGVAHKNHSDDEYFKQAIRNRLYVSQPEYSDSAKQDVIYFAAPVRDDETNEIIGVLRARIPTSRLKLFVGKIENEQGNTQFNEVHFIDGTGKMFLSTKKIDPEQVVTESADSEATDGLMGRMANEIFPGLAELQQSRQSGALQTVNAIDQELGILGYAPVARIQTLPDLQWAVLLETELDDLLKAERTLGRIIILGTLLSMIGVGAVGIVVSTRGVRPILQATAAVEQLGQGDFGTRLAVSGSDEISILSRNINAMADQIQRLLGSLKQNAMQLGRQNDVLSALSDVLSSLAQNEGVIQGDAKAAARAFATEIAEALAVERVSIWLYERERSCLTCLNQYIVSNQQHTQGDIIRLSEQSDYLQILEAGTLVAAETLSSHPAIDELIAQGQIPANTESILHIPIQISGRTIGVIRCDQVKYARVWQIEEQTFLTSVAHLLAIAIESEYLQDEVGHLLDIVSEVEEGDLTTQAQVSNRSTGLVADTLNRLVERLSQVMSHVLAAARQVSQEANQQKQLATIVATNADKQSQSVIQVLGLTEQVEQTAQNSAEQVNATSTSLRAVRTSVDIGEDAILQLSQGIGVLQDGTNRIIQQMKTLGEFVSLADQFVQDQSQIATLTQTLALNASLVAARASEQRNPSQFIVVAREFDSIADQVSKLAQQTNESLTTLEQRSTQIHSVVSTIDSDVQSLGGLVQEFTQGVEASNQAFSNVQAVTDQAVTASETVVQSSRAIAEAAQAAAPLARSIAQFATKTAELTQNSQMQSEQIDSLSHQLLQTIEFFQLPETAISEMTESETVVQADPELLPEVTQTHETTLTIDKTKMTFNGVRAD
ncbi:MAG: HAMP domain-containing protein [Cyanothece sp. SIO1E1]|nr:HAMP domain-containing protein [Cyanothece sp. SIO1E1]